MASDNCLDKQKNVNKFPVFLWVAVLVNAIIIALFVTFVFGLRKDAFDIDSAKLDRSMLIGKDNILSSVRFYNDRIKKIIESYPFSDFLQQTLLNGLDKTEEEKIVSIFRNGDYSFDSVSLYLADGQNVFSIPVRIKPIEHVNYLNYMKSSIAVYDESYDGIYFILPISNKQGIDIGYIAASVDKKIFENAFQSSRFILLPSGVVYYADNVDIKRISKERLLSLLNNTKFDESYIRQIEGTSLIFYSSPVTDVENLNIGLVEADVPIIQKSLKYIILSLLVLSFIFLIVAAIIEWSKSKKDLEYMENEEREEEHDIVDENIDINELNEDLDINEYTLSSLDEDISYLDNIIEKDKQDVEKDDIVDLPSVDELEKYVEDAGKYGVSEETKDSENISEDFHEKDFSDTSDYSKDRDVLVSHGAMLEDEISIKEEEYFSSKDAFNFSFNRDFLLEDDLNVDEDDESIILDEDVLKSIDLDEDIINKADENADFDTSDLVDEELYEPNEVPKVPDDYYRNVLDKEKVDISNGWLDVLKSIKGNKFVEKTMDDMIEWIKEESGVEIKHAVMLSKINLGDVYSVVDSRNVSSKTKELLKVDENEPLFTKILSYKKPLYVSDPFSSESLSEKFAKEDKENIVRMIFIPIESESNLLESFFIGLSEN